jgi:hypothetical protein
VFGVQIAVELQGFHGLGFIDVDFTGLEVEAAAAVGIQPGAYQE